MNKPDDLKNQTMRAATSPLSPGIAFPWGDAEPYDLRPPQSWSIADVVEPDLTHPVADYPDALRTALNNPVGGLALESLVRSGSRIAIVVDDPSRWTPVGAALPVLLDRLAGLGVTREAITISVGVGRHHAVDPETMARRVGADVAASYRCFSPPVDNLAEYDDLGPTADGVPVRVFRPVARADVRILIGSVLPHMQAGFGGGYKLIFPGTSHRSTLAALHRRGLGGDGAARLLGGNAAANPMRQAIHAAAAKLGPCLSISHLLGPPGTVLQVLAGHPDAVQDELAASARHRFQAPEVDPSGVDVVVAGNAPWPGDPMMSFKVLLQHRSAGRPGGVLVGFFWTDPAEIDRTVPLPTLRAIAATGAPGAWVIRRGLKLTDRLMARLQAPSEFLIRWARELVVDRTVLVYAPPLYDQVGPRLGPVRLFNDQAQLWEAATAALSGVKSPRCRIFPQGGLTYCPAR